MRLLVGLLILTALLAACSTPQSTVVETAIAQTAAVQTTIESAIAQTQAIRATIEAGLTQTQTARIPTSTREPTQTPNPTDTPQPTDAPQPTNTPPPATTPTPQFIPSGSLALVTRVIDGDTIDVNYNGLTYRVRYIGIDTPESNQPCSKEATAANIGLVLNQKVQLDKDVSETDRYGRLLRYVYLGDVFVNAELVARGFAEAVEYPPDTSQAAYLESLEGQARAANLNCYAMGAFGGVPVTLTPIVAAPTPTETPPTSIAAPTPNCDPSYPDVCIPPPPPDLDCPNVPYRNFRVLPPDTHRFDRDGDGIGCET